MTEEEKLVDLKRLCEGVDYADTVFNTYLSMARRKVLNRRFPFDASARKQEVPEEYEGLQIELATVLIMQRGAEGQSQHSENGVTRVYRTEDEILSEITPFVGVL